MAESKDPLQALGETFGETFGEMVARKPAFVRAFLEHVRVVSEKRRQVLGQLRTALEAHDDAAALTLARVLVGLSDGPEG